MLLELLSVRLVGLGAARRVPPQQCAELFLRRLLGCNDLLSSTTQTITLRPSALVRKCISPPFIFPSGVLFLGVLVSSTSIGESHTREQLTGQAPIDKMQAVGSEPLCL